MDKKRTELTNYYIEYYDSYYKEWKRTFLGQLCKGKFSTLESALQETRAIKVKWRIVKEDLISTESVVICCNTQASII